MKKIFFVLFVMLSFVACGLDAAPTPNPPDPSTMDIQDLQEWGEEVPVHDPSVLHVWNALTSGKDPGPETGPVVQDCWSYGTVRGCCMFNSWCRVCFADGRCTIYYNP